MRLVGGTGWAYGCVLRLLSSLVVLIGCLAWYPETREIAFCSFAFFIQVALCFSLFLVCNALQLLLVNLKLSLCASALTSCFGILLFFHHDLASFSSHHLC